MYLITGATGIIGRPLVEVLHAEGVPVRAVTRNPRTANLPAGVEVIDADPSRPDTLARHLDGVTGLFLHPRAAGLAGAELLALAKDRGVRRVVALAALNVDDDLDEQPSRFRGDLNRENEQAAVESGLEWVSLRAGYFARNALLSWGAQIRAGDVVFGPYAKNAESPVHELDLAEVGARALRTDELVGRRPVLTGPDSLTHEELVTIIGEVLGRPLRYQEIPPEAAKQGMLQLDVPEPFVTALLARFARELGQPAPVTGEVEKALGVPARTFSQWVTDHAADFRA